MALRSRPRMNSDCTRNETGPIGFDSYRKSPSQRSLELAALRPPTVP